MANKWFETVAVAQRRARRHLPKGVYLALVAGAEAGVTMRDNVDAFSERLREQLDLDALCGELRAIVTGTVHPAHASLWRRSEPEPRVDVETPRR